MTGGGHGGRAVQPCLFMLFPEGERPQGSAVRAALARSGTGHISYDPPASDAEARSSDWLEVVVDGLTFDLLGLSPGSGLLTPPPRHLYGLSAPTLAGCEAIGLAPGPHLAGAASAMPVVRTLLRLASALASQWSSALGAVWLPADSAMRKDLFVSAIDAWLAGGPFPALGLTGVTERGNGIFASDGLSFFIGQELVLDPVLSADRTAATRLLARLIDRLVGHPPLSGELTIRVEGRQNLRLVGAGPVIDVSPG